MVIVALPSAQWRRPNSCSTIRFLPSRFRFPIGETRSQPRGRCDRVIAGSFSVGAEGSFGRNRSDLEGDSFRNHRTGRQIVDRDQELLGRLPQSQLARVGCGFAGYRCFRPLQLKGNHGYVGAITVRLGGRDPQLEIDGIAISIRQRGDELERNFDFDRHQGFAETSFGGLAETDR